MHTFGTGCGCGFLFGFLMLSSPCVAALFLVVGGVDEWMLVSMEYRRPCCVLDARLWQTTPRRVHPSIGWATISHDQPQRSVRSCFDCGLWVVGCGLWVVGCGLWVVGCGLLVVSCFGLLVVVVGRCCGLLLWVVVSCFGLLVVLGWVVSCCGLLLVVLGCLLLWVLGCCVFSPASLTGWNSLFFFVFPAVAKERASKMPGKGRRMWRWLWRAPNPNPSSPVRQLNARRRGVHPSAGEREVIYIRDQREIRERSERKHTHRERIEGYT